MRDRPNAVRQPPVIERQGACSLFPKRFLEVIKAITPLIGVVCVLQVTVIHAPAVEFLQFLAGSALAVAGLLLLLSGIDLGILPMGRFIGAELPSKRSLSLIVAVAVAMGFATTAAEPDVLVLSGKVEAASQTISAEALTYLIAAGVGLFAALALVRIVYGFSMRILLTVAYALVILLSFLAPAEYVPLAFDAGSVTTGLLSAPVLLALAVGLSSVLAERSAARDGFGLLGLASVGPILLILILGLVP